MPQQSWRYAWYESETPESIDMPCGYKDTASAVPEFESNVMGMIPKLCQTAKKSAPELKEKVDLFKQVLIIRSIRQGIYTRNHCMLWYGLLMVM